MPDVVVSSSTPARPRSRITWVARVTSESVTEASARSKAAKRSGRNRSTPGARVGFGAGYGDSTVRHRNAAGAAAGERSSPGSARSSSAARSSSGPRCEAFERELAAYLGVRHVVGVANGTDAITIALRALGVRPGDEVVVPSFTFYATAEAVVTRRRQAGVLRRRSRHPQRHARHGPRGALDAGTKAIVAVDLFGCPAPVAGAAGARPAGARGCRPGGRSEPRRSQRRRARRRRPRSRSTRPRTSAASATAGRSPPTTTNIAELARALRFHGSRDKQTFEYVGYNSRLDELQAAILRVLLPQLDQLVRRPPGGGGRIRAGGLGEHVTLPVVPDGARAGVAPVRGHASARRRPAGGAAGPGIQSRGYYRTPLHRQPAMAPYAGDGLAAAGYRRAGADQPGAADEPGARRGLGRARWRRCSRPGRSGGQLRIWVDLTNSPHVLVMRPVIAKLRDARARRGGHRAGLRPDAAGCVSGSASSTRRSAATEAAAVAAKARGLAERSLALRAVGPGARLRPRARARIQRHHGRGRAAADPARDDVRLRVGDGPAQRQLPPRPGRGRARRDPAGAPVPLRRPRQDPRLRRASRRSTTWPTSSPIPRCSASSGWTEPADRRSSGRRPRSRSTTASRTTCSRRCSNGCAARRPSCCRAHAQQRVATGARGWLHRARAGDRRAVAGRVRGSRRVRGRDDEPRGGGARDTRVHGVRGAAGGGRRAADRRGAAAPADLGGRDQARKAPRRRGSARPGEARSGDPGRAAADRRAGRADESL